MRKLGIDEWIVRRAKAMYDGGNLRVRINGCFSESFKGSWRFCFKPATFCFCDESSFSWVSHCCPRELLYADDLVIMSDNLEDLKIQLQAWRTSLNTHGLRINVGKTNIIGLSEEAQKPTANVKWPCDGCSKGVGVNAIPCQTYILLIHKRCSGVKGTLKKERIFRCNKCKGESVPPDNLTSTQVHVGEDTIQAATTFWYLADVIGESGGCVDASSARITTASNGFAWNYSTEGNYFQSLPILVFR